MKQDSSNKTTKIFVTAARAIFALFITSLLTCFLIGCNDRINTVIVFIRGDAHVTIEHDPAQINVSRGSLWKDVKKLIKVSYEDEYIEDNFFVDDVKLTDNYRFNQNATVNVRSKPLHEKITVTVSNARDLEHVTVLEPRQFKVLKGSLWKDIKDKIKVKYKEGYEEGDYWGTKHKIENDDEVFTKNTTIFVCSKPKDGIPYKVEHWQQNIENDEYTVYESEVLSGKAGEDTDATAKTYEGFTAKTVTQQKIKANGSTVVQVKYDRNLITLKLNLNGGTTTTALTDGNKLKGKFGAKVMLKDLKKGSDILRKWEPELPETFPASSPDTTYTASWVDGYIVTIKGDERTEITENTFKVNLNPIQTWNDIAVQVSLKSEWQDGDYEVYEWRLGDENGQKLTDDYRIDKHITVYAVTNYAKFNIIGDKISLTADGNGYTGAPPKGKIIIPDGITEIEDSIGPHKGAFSYCDEITSVKFPQGLTKIGSSAFLKCTGLKSINLPESLNQIGRYAFLKCTGLKSINLPEGLTQIGEDAFSYCTGLTSINLPASLNQISSRAFLKCTGLKSINLHEGLTQIGDWAFFDCTSLTSINLPESLTQIGHKAFSGCRGLTSINLPKGLNQIGEDAFFECTGLTSINLPASLNQIGRCAFANCSGLTSAVFEDKTGWAVYDNDTYTGTSTPVNLDDASTAAQYLRLTYTSKYWKKR